jgi:hypothetical protein
MSVFRNIYQSSQDGLELIVTIREKLEVLEKQERDNHQKQISVIFHDELQSRFEALIGFIRKQLEALASFYVGMVLNR